MVNEKLIGQKPFVALDQRNESIENERQRKQQKWQTKSYPGSDNLTGRKSKC